MLYKDTKKYKRLLALEIAVKTVLVLTLCIIAIKAWASPVNLAPLDSDGNVFIENFTGDLSNWQTENNNVVLGGSSNYGSIYADDGLMGEKYLHTTAGYPAFETLMFDHTKYIRYTFRTRVNGAWTGIVNFNGEGGWYDGLTTANYGWTILNSYKTAQVMDMQIEWIPPGYYSPYDNATAVYRARVKAASDSSYGAWTTIPNSASPPVLTTSPLDNTALNLVWPFSLWWASQYAVDIGTLKIAGNPVWGGFDGNWHGWTMTNCGMIEGVDYSGPVVGGSKFGEVGGLIYASTSGTDNQLGYHNYDSGNAISYNATFSATSPTVGLAANTSYSKLWIQAYEPSGGYLAVKLRNAADNSLITSINCSTFANTSGILTPGTAHSLLDSTTGQTATIKELDISAIPAGTTFYVDVEGKTAASGYSPRLGGVWTLFNYTAPAIVQYNGRPRIYHSSSGHSMIFKRLIGGTWK